MEQLQVEVGGDKARGICVLILVVEMKQLFEGILGNCKTVFSKHLFHV